MTRFGIDAPTLLHLVAEQVVVDPAHQLVAPQGIRSQALQLLLDAVRGGTTSEHDALRCHERVTEVRIRLLGDRVSRRTAWQLARELDCTVSAAEVLAVTRLQADALVTIDPELGHTASGIVRLATVEDLTRP
jgi:cytosine/adenosine deaminase-related metal-dependent hydrolase